MNFTNIQETPIGPSATSDELHTNPLPYAEAVQSTSRWGSLRKPFHKQKKTHHTEPESPKEPSPEPESEGLTLAEMGY